MELAVVNLRRLKSIRAVDPDNNSITVDAGVVLADVQAAAAAAGRLFPLSLGSEGSCQVGGVLSTNAGGIAVLRYGTMRDLALGLEVVLPDGTLWSSLKGLRKDNTGYDLKQLFLGAEGTLGIITGAVLKTFPVPARRETAFVAVASVGAAVALLHRLQDWAAGMVGAYEYISATRCGWPWPRSPTCASRSRPSIRTACWSSSNFRPPFRATCRCWKACWSRRWKPAS